MSLSPPFHFENLKFLHALSPVLATAGLALISWATGRPVEISLEDGSRTLRTHARTVAAALEGAGIEVQPADEVQPAGSTDLSDVRRIEVRRARPVTIETDDGTQVVMTPAQYPANILQDAGFRLLPGDRLWADGLPVVPGARAQGAPSRVRLERGRARAILVDRGGQVIRTAEPTLAQALWQAGHRLYEGDRIEPGWQSDPSAPAPKSYEPSRPTTILVDGGTVPVRTAGETVGEALAQAGISLQGLDQVRPRISQAVPEREPIQITRVREEVIVELEPVPFETTFQPNPEAEIDTKRVIDTGSFGVRANQIRVRLEDGEEVERNVEGQWLAREPEPRIVGYGTNIIVRTLDTPDGTIEYWRAVEMWATSYSPSRAGVSPDARNFGITASGKALEKGLVAIDRSLIPFGTRMYVLGYGFAEAADTGGGVIGRWIDLGYDDDNYRPWAQYVTVYFLTPVPPAGSITWILP